MTIEMKQSHFAQAVIIWVVTHCSLLGDNQLLTAHKSTQRRSPHYHNPCIVISKYLTTSNIMMLMKC
jgi:hypothetical protein